MTEGSTPNGLTGKASLFLPLSHLLGLLESPSQTSDIVLVSVNVRVRCEGDAREIHVLCPSNQARGNSR